MRLSPAFHVYRLAAICVALMGIAGCGASDDVHQWAATEKAKKGVPLKPLPVVKTFENFVYKDQDLRDPFGLSPAEQQDQPTDTGPHPPDHAREPLESYPLDGLKMAGTIGAGAQMEGLIRDPDGVIHRVHVGNWIGQNYGRITAISEDRIDLVELIAKGAAWTERPASVGLSETKK